MLELYETITAWPTIIQGALGSALFASIVFFGQKLYIIILNFLSKFSTKLKKQLLDARRRKYYGLKAAKNKETLISTSIQIGLIYHSVRNVLKGLIWILLGLIIGNGLYIYEVIGYIGGLFYIFKALSYVQGIETDVDVDKTLSELNKKIKELETK